VPFYSPSQAINFSGNGPPPSSTLGPTVRLVVVGIEANETDFPSGSPSFSLFVGPAFARHFGSQVATLFSAFVRLRHGPAELARFTVAARSLAAPGYAYTESFASTGAGVQHSIEPQAIGWELLALLAGLAALAVVGQAFARQGLVQAESYPTLRALGVRPGEFLRLGLLTAGSVGLLGAVGAVGLALSLSPLTPVGVARIAAPSTGFVFDPLVLGLGALGVLLPCLALGAFAAWRWTRAPGDRRGSESVTARGSRAIAPWRSGARALPSALVGTRRALQRGSGSATLPVGTALLGSSLAVTALVATAVFSAGLSNLTRTPSLYGQAWQLEFTNMTAPQFRSVLSQVESDGAIDRISYGVGAPNAFTIGGISVPVIVGETVRGPLTFPVVSGHLPDGDGQIALGDSTLRQLGANIGSVVPVTIVTGLGPARTVSFEVVGTTSFAPVFGNGGIGDGALMTLNAAIKAVCGSGAAPACQQAVEQRLSQNNGLGMLIGATPGAAGRAAIASLAQEFASFVKLPVTPSYLVDFGEAVNFPLLLGIAVTLFGAATFTHLLVVSVSRRRRDVALLKALGFVRRQVAAAVGWQATTVALVAVAFGVPVGIALGRLLWRAFAVNLGAAPVSVVPGWVVVTLAVGVLVAANLLAVLPAVGAARLRPSEALRQQ
jgi:hypothetical protein